MPKGPLDRIAELKQTVAQLRAAIAAGQSGDGLTKPDLTAQLQIAEQELRTLLSANPARKMYPTMER